MEEFPYEPNIIEVDILAIRGVKDRHYVDYGPKTVLTFHGQSQKGRFWRQTAAPHRNVEDVIKEVEGCRVTVDALIICNPGSYELPEKDGRVPYTYALGKANSDLYRRGDKLVVTSFGDFDFKIRTGDTGKPFRFDSV